MLLPDVKVAVTTRLSVPMGVPGSGGVFRAADVQPPSDTVEVTRAKTRAADAANASMRLAGCRRASRRTCWIRGHRLVRNAKVPHDIASKRASGVRGAGRGRAGSLGRRRRANGSMADGAVVDTVTEKFVAVVPLVVKLAGVIPHVDSEGAPEQENEMVPLTPPVGATLKL